MRDMVAIARITFMDFFATIRLENSLEQSCAPVAPVYGDPLAGMAAYKCRFLTPNKHFDPICGLRRG